MLQKVSRQEAQIIEAYAIQKEVVQVVVNKYSIQWIPLQPDSRQSNSRFLFEWVTLALPI